MTLPTTSSNGATAQEVLAKSVTKNDWNDRPYPGAFHFMLPGPMSSALDLPPFWSLARDWMLFSTLYRESMWSAALSIAISKIVAMGFDIDSEIPLRAKRAQNLFLNMDAGKGYVSGLQKHLQSFCLTGNGGPIEIVRASSAAGSRILGLVPLDTFRATRTGDPEVPIIYQDRRGGWHEMRDYDVMLLSDMPDQSDTWFGLGHCAAERAYRTILKLEAIERYVYEKVSGQRALSIYFVNGVMPGQVEMAVDTSKAAAQAKGVVTYLGATIVPLAGDIPVDVKEVPLAELPDGFNRKEEWDIALNTYARCLGIAVQDLQPLSGQGLGTGTQSQVLDEAAKGQGLAAWRQMFEHAVNEYTLDDKTTFYIKTSDIRDREREAKVSLDFATTMKTWFDMGMPYGQIVNYAVDNDQMPPEYRVEGDLTPGEIISDDEKPDQLEADDSAVAANADQKPVPGQGQPKPTVPAPPDNLNAKEWREWTQRVAQVVEWQEAHKEAREAHSDELLAQAVGQLAQAVATPLPEIPAPDMTGVVQAIEKLATREQPAPVLKYAPTIQTDPRLTAALQALAASAQKEAPPAPDDGPRVIEVLEREADGTPRVWRDRPE